MDLTKTVLGVELGSTRIKAVLIDENHVPVASGDYEWENKLENGIWTYSLEAVHTGIRACFSALKEDLKEEFGTELTTVGAIGVSAMMHGYLPFDRDGKQLAEFRTWRNTITGEAAEKLTSLFGFNIPQRWSIAHLYHAYLNGEAHVKDIAFLTTLAGYFHYLLTGGKVLGIGEASGVFPIDPVTKDYPVGSLRIFNDLVENEVPWKIEDILPRVLLAGEEAGRLTLEGRDLLDESKELEVGIPFCPPEGDMGTGMVCTNSLAVGSGNASLGTSSNVTLVTGSEIGVYKEIDVIASPSGVPAALVHVNNGTSEINAWERLFKEVINHFDKDVDDGEIYTTLFKSARSCEKDDLGIYPVDYFSGEPVTHVNEGRPLMVRSPDAAMDLPSFMRSHIYALLATIRLGVDILRDGEGVKVTKIVGHGGFFKTKGVGEFFLSAALGVPVLTLPSAGEGGPYGEALLASYLVEKKEGESLEEYLDKRVFATQESHSELASPKEMERFNSFLVEYRKSLNLERVAIKSFAKDKESRYEELKKRVYEQNIRLVKEGLISLTWGNVSEIDRELGVIAIKPSGVSYEKMKVEDIVILDLEGHVIEGDLRPSSDTPTHLELYRNFPLIGGVVHTHSTFAVAFAQAKRSVSCYGTTHADSFFKEVPCTRDLAKEEIEGEYELNTGKVIVETFKDRDYMATPAALSPSHGPFCWGKNAVKAVDSAVILEKVCQMNLLSELLSEEPISIDPVLEKKHHDRKHGKNAYYGQKEKK